MSATDAAQASGAAGVPRGLVPGPFHDRLAALSITRSWTGWDGFASPLALDGVEGEYFAIRNQATLFDISPMRKYRIAGPQAERVVNRLVTRDVGRIRPGRVGYAIWCDEDGMVIDDGTVFRFAACDFRLCCQESQIGWLHDVSWGFETTLEDESEAVAALALQGPTSFAVLEAAGLGAAARLKPFDLAELEPGLVVSRTGFTGDLGYELWTDRDVAPALWDRLWAAGAPFGLRAIGTRALDMARLEAGFVMTGVDFRSIHHAIRPTRGRTPYDLGMERMVHFDKGHFNGRRALLALRDREPAYRLVGLDIDGMKPAHSALVHHRRREVGRVTTAGWSPTAKRNLALAELRSPYGTTRGERLSVEIHVDKEGKWERVMAPARIVPRPFLDLPRARATPPGRT